MLHQEKQATRNSLSYKLTLIIVGILVGGIIVYGVGYSYIVGRIDDLEDSMLIVQEQIANPQSTQNITNQNVTYVLYENVSLSQIYEQVEDSIVGIRGIIVESGFFGRTIYTQVQGSGFVYNVMGQMVIITNYHVVTNAINITVTFTSGNGYAATVLGTDPYSDLAVLITENTQDEFVPLEIINSSMLIVGNPVIVVGNPYGLTGSLSTGIISALGRTITEEMTGDYPIANVIQTTAPLNPGNSGGPLLDYQGRVIDITTAIVEGSQGVGFAIPSNTILREIEYLVTEGFYDDHSWLGATGIDLSYEIATTMGTNVTSGWLIVQVLNNGPADKADLQGATKQVQIAGERINIGGDIIIAINNERITNRNDLSSYLEEYTLPGHTIDVTIVRNSQIMNIAVKLEKRP